MLLKTYRLSQYIRDIQYTSSYQKNTSVFSIMVNDREGILE